MLHHILAMGSLSKSKKSSWLVTKSRLYKSAGGPTTQQSIDRGSAMAKREGRRLDSDGDVYAVLQAFSKYCIKTSTIGSTLGIIIEFLSNS